MIGYFWFTTSIFMLVFGTSAIALTLLISQYTTFNVLSFPIQEAKAVKNKTPSSHLHQARTMAMQLFELRLLLNPTLPLLIASITTILQEQLLSAVVVQLDLPILITNSKIPLCWLGNLQTAYGI